MAEFLRRWMTLAMLSVLLAACAGTTPPGGVPAPAPTFAVDRFFPGHTAGEGVLRVAFRRAEAVHVTGEGRLEVDGTLVLDQEVRRGTRRPERRQWRIRSVGQGRIAGSLSDAAGPVTGEVEGNRLVLRFPMKGGLAAEQRLFLQPGGHVALNRMVVRKLGLTVAVLDETIRRR